MTEIINYVNMHGGQPSLWYLGITDNPSRRAMEHNASVQRNHWAHFDAGSEKNARAIENYLIDSYGFQGATGGGQGPNCQFVYVYFITAETTQ